MAGWEEYAERVKGNQSKNKMKDNSLLVVLLVIFLFIGLLIGFIIDKETAKQQKCEWHCVDTLYDDICDGLNIIDDGECLFEWYKRTGCNVVLDHCWC